MRIVGAAGRRAMGRDGAGCGGSRKRADIGPMTFAGTLVALGALSLFADRAESDVGGSHLSGAAFLALAGVWIAGTVANWIRTGRLGAVVLLSGLTTFGALVWLAMWLLLPGASPLARLDYALMVAAGVLLAICAFGQALESESKNRFD